MGSGMVLPGGNNSDADDEGLVGRLFRDHYTALVRLACVLVDDRESGEDVVQDAFVQLHANLDRIRDVDAAPAYLRSIVLNLARSRLRRRGLGRVLVLAAERLTPTPPYKYEGHQRDQSKNSRNTSPITR